MTDTPIPDWVLLEAAKRGAWCETATIKQQQAMYRNEPLFAALCDMILKHEQPPVDPKLLCAREAAYPFGFGRDSVGVDACVRAIELWEEGFGK